VPHTPGPISKFSTSTLKIGEGLRPLLGRGAGSPSKHKLDWAEAYLHTEWHLDASSRLGRTEMGGKLGGGSAPFVGEGRLGLNTKSPAVFFSSTTTKTKIFLDENKLIFVTKTTTTKIRQFSSMKRKLKLKFNLLTKTTKIF